MKNYVCKRDEVCAGILLIRWDNVNNDYRTSAELLKDKFIAFKYKYGRVILFNNDLGKANDLIYNTPYHYPIVDLNIGKEIDSKYIINDYVNLDDIIRYLGYNENLTQYDLNMIFNFLVKSNRWLKRNRKLFGNDSQNSEEYFSNNLYVCLKNIFSISSKPHKEEPNYSLIRKK